MRRLPFLVLALTALAAPASARAAGPDTGGAAAPSFGGGITYGQPLQKVRRASRHPSRPVATEFTVTPTILDADTPATFSFRIDGRTRRVRVRIALTRGDAATTRLRLGYKRTGVRHRHVWAPEPGALPAAEYAVALQAFDDAGRPLRRTARASGRGRLSVQVAPPPAPVGDGLFPVQGAYSFGGADARFGAERANHAHEGQDIIAAEGTPLVAPVAGFLYWVAFQAKGAGHYVVLRGVDGRDYVFMHLKPRSITAVKGARLAAGQAFAQVGSTGATSGAHLHFEIWPDGWYSSKASAPIDPLPQLMAWAGTR